MRAHAGSSAWHYPERLEPRLLLSADIFPWSERYSLAARPSAVAVADVTGDGNNDVLVAIPTKRMVSILPGRGDGTFGSAQNIGFSAAPAGIAAADVNNDGLVDIVVSLSGSTSGWVAVVLNRGGNRYAPAVSYAVGVTPSEVAIADFNGDGRRDIVVLNLSGSVSVLLGNGNGTFQAQRVSETGLSPESLAVGDFDNDGRADVIVGSSGGNALSVLFGQGDGTFVRQSYPVGARHLCVGAADFNGDGFDDAALGMFSGLDPSVLVKLYAGSGQFASGQSYLVSNVARSLEIADVNRDGKLDIVAGSDSGGMILFGNGDGTFQPQQRFASGLAADFVTVADLNGDGWPDVILASDLASITVRLNHADAAAPHVGGLVSNTTDFANNKTITLTALGVSDPDGRVVKVEFYRDVDGDGQLSPGDVKLGEDSSAADGWRITASTAGFSATGNVLMAIARDNNGLRSEPGTLTLVGAGALLGPVWVSDSPATQGYPLAIQVQGNGDGIRYATVVEFWRDANGDGAITPGVDELLYADSTPSDGWGLVAQTGSFPLGPNTFLARGKDNFGNWDLPVWTTVDLVAPWSWAGASFQVSPANQIRPQPLLFIANLPAPVGTTLASVEIFRDANGNGVLDGPDQLVIRPMRTLGDTWVAEASTRNMPAGNTRFFIRARNSQGVWSEPISASAVIRNTPPTITSFAVDHNPVTRIDPFTLVVTARDDLSVTTVLFYADNGDGLPGPEDPLIGVDTAPYGGWTLTLPGGQRAVGTYRFYAVAMDSEGGLSDAATITVPIVNTPPVVGALATSVSTLLRGQPLSVTASGVCDPDWTLSGLPEQLAVALYLDSNGDGVAQDSELIGWDYNGADGWRWDIATDNLPLGANVFLAVARDAEGSIGKPTKAWAHVVHPVGVWQGQGATVTVYDLAGDVDVFAQDIFVAFGKNGTVSTIQLRGASPMDGVAVLIEGAQWVGNIVDARRTPLGVPLGEVAFIASDAPVKTINIKSGIAGYCLEGLQMGGRTFRGDFDGDGDLSDRTAILMTAAQPPVSAVFSNVIARGDVGGNVVVQGALKSLKVGGLMHDGDIRVTWPQAVRGEPSFSFTSVRDVSINAGRIKSVSAWQWLDTDARADLICGDWLGSLNIRGNGRLGIRGDFHADILMTKGDYRTGLGKAAVAGDLVGVEWEVTGTIGTIGVRGTVRSSQVRSTGNIGGIVIGAAEHSDFLAGVHAAVPRHAAWHTEFVNPLATIKSVSVRGYAVPRGTPLPRFVIDSNFSAGRFGTVNLLNVDLDNQGQSFGVFAARTASGTAIRRVNVIDKTTGQRWYWPTATTAVSAMPLDLLVEVI